MTESSAVREGVKNQLRTRTDGLLSLINEIEDEDVKASDEFVEANQILDQAVEMFNTMKVD